MRKNSKLKWVLLWGAGIRIVLGIAAIPLAPLLYRDNFLILVLLRPTKEVLLAAGFLARAGNVRLPEIVIAAVPLMVLGVWHFYYLGRQFSTEIKNNRLPLIGSKILPAERIRHLEKVLDRKGSRLVFLGRLAVFPSALLGAAAGSSDMPSKEYLPADGLGAAASIVEVLGAGFLLGAAYKEAGIWITVGGIVALAAAAVVFGRYLRRNGS